MRWSSRYVNECKNRKVLVCECNWLLHFGLTNSPATFQTMMDRIFEELITEGTIVVYINNILIFTNTLEQHQEVTHWVLQLLCKHNFFLKPKKCEFEQMKVEYLRVVISHNSVKMDPVEATRVMECLLWLLRRKCSHFWGLSIFIVNSLKASLIMHVLCLTSFGMKLTGNGVPTNNPPLTPWNR